jgi:hypothetical protein
MEDISDITVVTAVLYYPADLCLYQQLLIPV